MTDYIKAVSGEYLATKVVEIGDWNMQTSVSVNVAHGLGVDFIKIRSISVIIRNDGGNLYYKLERINTTGGAEGGIVDVGSASIRCGRLTGGFFDAVGFSTTPYNRGWVTFQYED